MQAAEPSEPVLACVPNFAEGRDPGVLQALLRAMAAPGVLLLDCFQSKEANRTILTLAGAPIAVCESVARAAVVAVERIDLTRQRGAHARIGALDVLPLVPVRGLHVAECAVLARETAVSLWQRLHLPSYLYAAAATRPDRMDLDSLRRGQFEGLREAVLVDPRRRPDVGGPGLHPSAGAVAVGARYPLVEMKVTLPEGRLTKARAIARTLRERQPGVEATAYAGDGETELLVKITDPRQMPVSSAYTAIAAGAGNGMDAVTGGQLVGLIPQTAYEAGAAWVQVFDRTARKFSPAGLSVEERILERRLLSPLPWPEPMPPR